MTKWYEYLIAAVTIFGLGAAAHKAATRPEPEPAKGAYVIDSVNWHTVGRPRQTLQEWLDENNMTYAQWVDSAVEHESGDYCSRGCSAWLIADQKNDRERGHEAFMALDCVWWEDHLRAHRERGTDWLVAQALAECHDKYPNKYPAGWAAP